MLVNGDTAIPAFPLDDKVSGLPQWATDAVASHDLTPLATLIVEHCTAMVFADNGRDPMFLEAFTASVTENVQTLRDVLRGLTSIRDGPLDHRLRFAAVEAELRVTQVSLQRSYRISFFLQWQYWADVIMQAAQLHDVDRDEALETLTSLAFIVHSYADSVILRVSSSFARMEEAFGRSRAHIRQRLVREILDGNGETMSPADLVTLDYSLSMWHLALFLPETSQGVAEQLLVSVRSAGNPLHSVLYPVRLASSVIWLGSEKPWTEERVARVSTALETARVRASISDPARDLPGFVKTFEQVRQMEQIRSDTKDLHLPNVIRYAQLRLEIILLQSPDLAMDFLRQVLGPLVEDTAEAAKLRTTLEVSFRFGSHVAAAEFLQLHEHTVRNRLQRVHELLGPLQECRTELQVALRLWRMLPHESPAADRR